MSITGDDRPGIGFSGYLEHAVIGRVGFDLRDLSTWLDDVGEPNDLRHRFLCSCRVPTELLDQHTRTTEKAPRCGGFVRSG